MTLLTAPLLTMEWQTPKLTEGKRWLCAKAGVRRAGEGDVCLLGWEAVLSRPPDRLYSEL